MKRWQHMIFWEKYTCNYNAWLCVGTFTGGWVQERNKILIYWSWVGTKYRLRHTKRWNLFAMKQSIFSLKKMPTSMISLRIIIESEVSNMLKTVIEMTSIRKQCSSTPIILPTESSKIIISSKEKWLKPNKAKSCTSSNRKIHIESKNYLLISAP